MHARRISPVWLFGAALVLGLLLLDRAGAAGRPLVKITGNDSVFYYSTAHSLLFDRDLDLSNQFARLPPENPLWAKVVPATGLPGCPFAIGFPLLEVPFLAAAHAVTALTGAPGDGYSRPYVLAYYLGLIVYLCVGMQALSCFLTDVGRSLGAEPGRARRIAWLVTFGVWPATTLGYYTFAPMAHVPSFMGCSLFLLAFWRAKGTASRRLWLLTGLSLGLTALCRWQEALFGIIPLAYDLLLWSRGRRPGPIGPWLTSRMMFAAGFGLMLIPQMIEWSVIYGHYLTIPQGGDFIELPPRHVMEVLLSTRHGWLTWTPIAVIGVLGLLYGCVRRAELAAPLLLALALDVMVIGALRYSYHAPGSFGMRFLTGSVPLLAVGLVLLLHGGSRALRGAVAGLGALCAVYSLLFAVQFRLDRIPREDHLTFDQMVTDKLRLLGAP